jgi:hypothetical protein
MVQRYRPEPDEPGKRQIANAPFQKGMTKTGGRQKGTPNKNTALIRDAICGAAEALGRLRPVYRYQELKTTRRGRVEITRRRTDEIIGWEATGEGGTQGYLEWMGVNYPKAFATLMGRTLPLQINAAIKPVQEQSVADKFGKVDIRKMTLAEKMSAMRDMIGSTQALPAPNPNDQIIEGQFSEIDPESVPPEYKEAAE